MQYEDPTEDVETMRDKIEAERCEGCEWLTKLAAEQQQSLAEMNGHAEEAPLKGVALSGENIKRAQKELRLTKQQVWHWWRFTSKLIFVNRTRSGLKSRHW